MNEILTKLEYSKPITIYVTMIYETNRKLNIIYNPKKARTQRLAYFDVHETCATNHPKKKKK